jgi:hypothetical protein
MANLLSVCPYFVMPIVRGSHRTSCGKSRMEVGRFHVPTALDNALTLIRERASRHGIALIKSPRRGRRTGGHQPLSARHIENTP